MEPSWGNIPIISELPEPVRVGDTPHPGTVTNRITTFLVRESWVYTTTKMTWMKHHRKQESWYRKKPAFPTDKTASCPPQQAVAQRETHLPTLLMEEIPNKPLGCIKPVLNSGINYLHLNWLYSWISSNNSMLVWESVHLQKHKNNPTHPQDLRCIAALRSLGFLKVFQRGTETGATPQNEATKDPSFWCFAWEVIDFKA